jgi:hypothetical protein
LIIGGYSFEASLTGAARTGGTDEDFHLSMVGLSKTCGTENSLLALNQIARTEC